MAVITVNAVNVRTVKLLICFIFCPIIFYIVPIIMFHCMNCWLFLSTDVQTRLQLMSTSVIAPTLVSSRFNSEYRLGFDYKVISYF
jgi:hypothetical protein